MNGIDNSSSGGVGRIGDDLIPMDDVVFRLFVVGVVYYYFAVIFVRIELRDSCIVLSLDDISPFVTVNLVDGRDDGHFTAHERGDCYLLPCQNVVDVIARNAFTNALPCVS